MMTAYDQDILLPLAYKLSDDDDVDGQEPLELDEEDEKEVDEEEEEEGIEN